MVLVSLVASVTSAGIGAFAVAIALKTGSNETVQGTFPLMFALMFFSSAFFPRETMTGWFKTAATINPVSHMIEGLRAQIIFGIALGDYATAVAIAGAFFVVGIALARLALRARLAER